MNKNIIKKISTLINELIRKNQKYEARELEKIYFDFKKNASYSDNPSHSYNDYYSDEKNNEEQLKYMDFSKLYDEEPKNQKEKMLLFAEAVAKKLNLYSPMFLGSGAGAYAFSTSNEDGENVVMKLIPDNEINIYKKIKNIKKDESSEYYNSLLPEIYEVKSFNELNDDNALDYFLDDKFVNQQTHSEHLFENFAVVTMEELEKPNENILNIISKAPSRDSNNYRLLLNSLNKDADKLISKVSNIITETIRNSAGEDYTSSFQKYIINIINSNLNKLKKSDIFEERQIHLIINEILSSIKTKINEYKKENKNIIILNSLNKLLEPIEKEIIIFKNEMIRKTTEPASYLKEPAIKGQEEYVFKLNDLKTNSDIIPRDLHGGNIMFRPGTQEVVFPDVGLFSIKSDFDLSDLDDSSNLSEESSKS